MKAELEDIGGGMFMHLTYKDDELEKKVKLAFSLVLGDQFMLTLSREALEDLTDLINRTGNNEQT